MSNFFSRLFGSKKKSTKAISRRLELLGLEERIVPTVTASFSGSTLLLASDDTEFFTVSSNNIGQVTVTGTSTLTTSGVGSNVTITGGNVITVDSGASNVQLISITGSGNNNQIVTLNDILSGGFNSNFGLSLDLGDGTSDVLNLGGTIALKGSGTLDTTSSNIETITLGSGYSALALTSVSGLVKINAGTALHISSNNVTINSTSGNVALADAVTSGAGGSLTINAGSGTVSTQGLAPSSGAIGAVSLTSTATSNPSILVNGAITSSGSVILNGSGDISVSGAISAASVNAKSTAGDVIFADTVTTTQVGGFTSEATLSNKATKIANLVSVGAGASALITGNLITTGNNTVNVSPAYVLTQTGPGITVTATGAISITGKVDALASTNDLYLTAVNGAINITGAVGSGLALDQLFVDGLGSFAANGSITANTLGVGFLTSSSFATSISFADAVKVTGANYDFKIPNDNNLLSALALEVVATGAGTVSFSKTIEASNAAATVYLQSQNGNIQVDGTITSKNGLSIYATGSGFVTLNDNVTTDQANGQVIISSNTGGISTKGVTTSGALANINIDTDTSGDIIIGGNISTSGGGDILLGADAAVLPPYIAYGTGNLTINGTVSTSGSSSTSGDIAIGSGGTGTITVNKAVSTGTATNAGSIYILALGNQMNTINFSKDAAITSANIINFRTTGSTNTISFASGANITSAGDVTDSYSGPGNINLAGNISTSNGLISFSDVSVNLTGSVSMKAGGQGGNINLGNTNGAQNLTLETTGNIVATSSTAIGGLTPLNSLTVVNSSYSVFLNLNSASVTITDTTNSIYFNGNTVISKSLTTTTEGYSVSFINGKTAVISGAPVFLNTGNVSLQGTTSLPSGATITGGPATVVNLSGTIVSGGAFNIGAGSLKTNIADFTTLNLNSTTQESTIANRVVLAGGDTFYLNGVGTLTLSGDSSDPMHVNGFVGNAIVTNGTINVTGKLCLLSGISLINATITGNGEAGGIYSYAASTVAPSGTLTMDSFLQDTSSTYKVSIFSPVAASKLLQPNSAPVINNSTLALSEVVSGLIAGDQFTIIDAGGSSRVTGSFRGLPEGATISALDTLGNTVTFAISYVGGSGNDVTLRVTNVSIANPSAIPQPMVAGQPLLNFFTAVGADAGGGPMVTVTIDILPGLTTVPTYFSFFAYDAGFTGGVRVAINELDGDANTTEIITGAGPGGGPNVKVFQFNFATLTFNPNPIASFFAFNDPNFQGGVYVAGGDVTGDGIGDLLVGAGASGGPRVQVYAGSFNGLKTSAPVSDFFAYSTAFTGGVVVAAGDRTGDSTLEVITGPASNGGYNIKLFNVASAGNNPTLVENFFAFNDFTSIGGVSIATAPFDANPMDDLVIGTTNTQFGVILNQNYAGIKANPFPGFTGAIRAGFADNAQTGYQALAAAGPGGGPVVSTFNVGASSLTQTDSLFVFDPAFTGGLFAAN